jgi:hypothetical protein
MNLFRACLFIAVAAPLLATAEPPSPLIHAHSHNDYEQKRPLGEALDHGFGSVEADIHLEAGKLLVGHDAKDLSPDRTLERLYLAPLKAEAEKNGGRVYGPDSLSVVLLIDIKTAAEPTYAVLKGSLEKYRSILTEFSPAGIKSNAVTVILSGNRPRAVLLRESNRLAAFDGRLADLGKQLPVSFMPLVSDNWQQHFQWRGQGPLSPADQSELSHWVSKIHAEGRKLRFWGVPDNEAAWRYLSQAGVDYLNTDKIPELARFLRAK